MTAHAYIRPMLESDLEIVLGWRNSPEVRRFMWTKHDIGIEEHRHWFEQALREAGRHLFVFMLDGDPSGFIQLSPTGVDRVADWGFYRAPSAPRGSGHQMGKAALEYAFGQLRLDKVCGQAAVENEPSVKFHLSHGFTQEGVLKAKYFDGAHSHDVAIFGLNRKDWAAATAQADE